MKNTVVMSFLNEERIWLKKVIRHAEKALKRAPEGSVLIRKHKKGIQFYRRTDSKDKNGVYIPVSNKKEAISLVQKRYLQRIIKSAEKQLRLINNFLKSYDPDALIKVFEREGEIREPFINAYELSDELYIKKWMEIEYEKPGFSENQPVHYTSKNERVRSKSEVLIANELDKENIPYKYETTLEINGRIYHPDFTILRLRDRKEMYWEHLGLLDDPDYRRDAIIKLRDYEELGIYLGDNLIITLENGKVPLNLREVKNTIKHYIQ